MHCSFASLGLLSTIYSIRLYNVTIKDQNISYTIIRNRLDSDNEGLLEWSHNAVRVV